MQQLLTIFRALADPTRLRIMLLLQEMELAVGELAQLLEQSQPRISRHIRILSEAGLAERRKEGSWVFLRPGPAAELKILNRLFQDAHIVQSDDVAYDRDQLSLVRATRAKMAEEYFAAHAMEWDAIRSLHISESEVEQAIGALFGDTELGHLLDVGTGTGRMIELFGKAASQITAIDNSPEMLRLTRAKLINSDSALFGKMADKTNLQLGDFNALPVADQQIDTVIVHQVLHYAQNPEQVILEIGRVLRDDGTLLIVDFAAHNREELRTDHAHARLGFTDDNMQRWCSRSGIKIDNIKQLDGGELSVKLWFGRKNNIADIHPKPLSSKRTSQ